MSKDSKRPGDQRKASWINAPIDDAPPPRDYTRQSPAGQASPGPLAARINAPTAGDLRELERLAWPWWRRKWAAFVDAFRRMAVKEPPPPARHEPMCEVEYGRWWRSRGKSFRMRADISRQGIVVRPKSDGVFQAIVLGVGLFTSAIIGLVAASTDLMTALGWLVCFGGGVMTMVALSAVAIWEGVRRMEAIDHRLLRMELRQELEREKQDA